MTARVNFLKKLHSIRNMTGTVTIKKEAIIDLLKIKEEFDSVIESLELMSDEKFMNSYNNSKNQIKKREFNNWDEL